MVNKGKVSTILNEGAQVTVKPYAGDVVTVPLVVPFFLFKCLEVGTPVVYVTFQDNTGVILARMDGEWNHKLEGDVEIVEKVTARDFATGSVPSYNQHTHNYTHGGVSSGTDTTSAPK